MRLHTLLLLAVALLAGGVALTGIPVRVAGTATVIFFICMNLAAISLVIEPYGPSARTRSRAAAEPDDAAFRMSSSGASRELHGTMTGPANGKRP